MLSQTASHSWLLFLVKQTEDAGTIKGVLRDNRPAYDFGQRCAKPYYILIVSE